MSRHFTQFVCQGILPVPVLKIIRFKIIDFGDYLVEVFHYMSDCDVSDLYVVDFKTQGVRRSADSPTRNCLDEHGDSRCPTGSNNEWLSLVHWHQAQAVHPGRLLPSGSTDRSWQRDKRTSHLCRHTVTGVHLM